MIAFLIEIVKALVRKKKKHLKKQKKPGNWW